MSNTSGLAFDTLAPKVGLLRAPVCANLGSKESKAARNRWPGQADLAVTKQLRPVKTQSLQAGKVRCASFLSQSSSKDF